MVAYRGMKKATKAELAHLAAVKELYCVVCRHAQELQITPTQVHHILRGNKRLGHFFVLPLCEHHHAHIRAFRCVEPYMWNVTNKLLGITRDWPQSKIIPRKV